MRWLASIAACAVLVVPAHAQACISTASYRSVVLNQEPSDIPENATVYRVQLEDAYVVTMTRKTNQGEKQFTELHGIKGRLLDEGDANVGDTLPTPRAFEIKARLGSMCNTWTEVWSDDHHVRDGKLFGFIVGRADGQSGETMQISPMLFRAGHDRKVMDEHAPGSTHGFWLLDRESQRPNYNAKRYQAREGGEWKPIRFDAKAMAQTLPNTNRLIRKGLQKLDREQEKEE